MSEILPNLYLGSLRDATDDEQLRKYKIKVRFKFILKLTKNKWYLCSTVVMKIVPIPKVLDKYLICIMKLV